jgi:hypothetical protein
MRTNSPFQHRSCLAWFVLRAGRPRSQRSVHEERERLARMQSYQSPSQSSQKKLVSALCVAGGTPAFPVRRWLGTRASRSQAIVNFDCAIGIRTAVLGDSASEYARRKTYSSMAVPSHP